MKKRKRERKRARISFETCLQIFNIQDSMFWVDGLHVKESSKRLPQHQRTIISQVIKINPYLNPHRQTPKIKICTYHNSSYFHKLNTLWTVNNATEKERGPFGVFQKGSFTVTSLTVYSMYIGLPGLFWSSTYSGYLIISRCGISQRPLITDGRNSCKWTYHYEVLSKFFHNGQKFCLLALYCEKEQKMAKFMRAGK